MFFSSIYGSRQILAKHLEGALKSIPQPSGFHWQHGWIPQEHNGDPDAIIGEGGWAARQLSHVFLVAREDQQDAMRQHGFERVRAFGLPFAYALHRGRGSVPRQPRSLLVMPSGHATAEIRQGTWRRESEYVDDVAAISHRFSSTSVVLMAEDIRLGRAKIWQDAGFDVLRGAGPGDPASLESLVGLLSGAEFVTTNGWGSHVAYAAASGCKVSIYGPSDPIQTESTITLFRNRPDLVDLDRNWGVLVEDRLRNEGFYNEPHAAAQNERWGLDEIGFNHVRPANETREILTNLCSESNQNLAKRLGRNLRKLESCPAVWEPLLRTRNFLKKIYDA